MSALHRIALPFHRVIVMLLLMLVLGIVVLSKTNSAQAAAISGNINHGIPATICPGSPMQTRFMNQWESIMRSASGTVNPNGYLKVIGTDLIPYHSIETFMVEAPDHGHELSSETLSYLLWFAAQYANVTGDFSYYNNAWNVTEKYSIPNAQNQPNGGYNANSPSTYAGEYSLPSLYPAALNSGVPVGQDPLYSELVSAYGNAQIYGMHWLFDGDNFYGFGNRNDGTSQMAYINTFQRGPQESTWETIPQPSWDTMKWGAKVGGTYQGFGPFFIGGAGAAKYSYTNAPDADARAVQAALLAQDAATKWGVNISAQNARAAKMGDYLRYAMAEKSFKAIPCASMSGSCPGGTGKNSLHYLMSWYYAWGGDASAGSWSWRIGDYAAHFGYQNPIAALALSTDANFRPLSATGAADWNTSFKRQLDFYQWLQSAEGAIAGGAEFGQVSSSGSYTAAPAGTPAFNGLTYVENPVYLDPGSNTWFGFQAWSMQRITELYYRTNNAQAAAIATKWANWLKTGNVFRFIPGTNGEDVEVASTIDWDGAPAGNFTTNGTSNPPANPGLHVSIVNYGQDMGTMSSAVNGLTWYAAATQRWGTLDTAARDLAKRVLDAQWNNHRTAVGVAGPEARADYKRFHDPVYVPAGMSGTTPRCAGVDCIVPGATFKSIRPAYQQDVDYNRVEAAIAAGTAPVFTFHRFWAQVDVALANSFWGQFFETCGPTATNTPGGPTATRTNTPIGPTATRTNTPVIVPTNTSVVPTNTTIPPTTGPSNLTVQIRSGGTDNNQQTAFTYAVRNTGTSAVSNVSVRVYFTLDGTNAASNYTLEKYYDQSGVATISAPTLASGTTYYFQVNYGTASLAAGAQWELQTAMHLANWGTNFSGGNDHFHTGFAVGALPAALTNTNYLPAYINGVRAWGIEPGGPVATNTPIQPTVPPTNTRTNTPVGPTFTPSRTNTRTNTPVGPTFTPSRTNTRTNTPVGPTATRTNTTVAPTRTNTPIPASATPIPPTTGPSTLKVQYKAADTSTGDNQVKPHFRIVNSGSSAVALSELKIRYYFTRDNSAGLNFACDWAQVGCGNITAAFPALSPAATNADTYLELSFSAGAGSVSAGGNTGDIQARINHSDWTNFNESNDYSFDGTKINFADWDRVVLVRNGSVVWGIAPGGSNPTTPPTTAPTRTNTPGATPTRTNTPAVTATRTNTPIPVTPTRTNTPTTTTLRYPYNQPTSITFNIADVTSAWNAWKSAVMTSNNAGPAPRMRVMGGVDSASSVSEGMSYGMLFTLIFDEQQNFDGLFLFVKDHFNSHGLMDWHIGNPGQRIGTGGATDADVDIAQALVGACGKVQKGHWPASSNGINYCNEATAMINAVYNFERGPNNELLPGDTWNMAQYPEGIVNLSYFAPYAFTTFGKFTNNVAGWNNIITRNYQIADLAQAKAGNCSKLVPNWVQFDGDAQVVSWQTENYGWWSWDAARFGFRVAVDKAWYNTAKGIETSNEIGSFFSSVGINNVRAQYRMDGSSVDTYHSAFFVANAASTIWAAPAMTAVNCGAATSPLKSTPQQAYNDLLATVDNTYYSGAWRLFGLLLMTGNYPNFYELTR